MNDINRAIWELEQKKEQLNALILFLTKAGPANPQYHRISNCQCEYELTVSQLIQLNKIQQAQKESNL